MGRLGVVDHLVQRRLTDDAARDQRRDVACLRPAPRHDPGISESTNASRASQERTDARWVAQDEDLFGRA